MLLNQMEIVAKLDTISSTIAHTLQIDKADFFIAGGSIVSLCLGEVPKDYDVWFRTAEAFEKADRQVVGGVRSKYATTMNIMSGTIQLVKSRIGFPEDLVKRFDFLHTQAYYDPNEMLLKYDERFIRSKVLKYVPGNNDHVINTLERCLKFKERGYKVSTETLMDIMNDIRKMPEELYKEQSFGVSHGSR